MSLTTKLLAYVAAAAGVVAALGLPWFAASPKGEAQAGGQLPTLDGPVEEFFGGLARWFSAGEGTSATQAFAGADTALMVMVALALIGAGMAAVRGAELAGRWIMQAAALAIGVLVVVKLFQVAGTDALVELRRGAIVAMGCSGVMFATAAGVAQQKLRRQPPAAMSSLHDPGLRSARPGSVAPPGL